MRRRFARFFALVVLFAGAGDHGVRAHAALRLSDPLDGVALGDTPKAVRLTFSERPDAALSEIRVLDTTGASYQLGSPLPAADDPLTIFVNIRPLNRGVYTVGWRAVSAVDGHATTGAFIFGVGVEPTSRPSGAGNPSVSLSEVSARWFLIVGLVGLVGGAAATTFRFDGGGLEVAGTGCALAIAGVMLLARAQTENAATGLARLLTTDIGRALLWRAAAIAVAAVALVVAQGVRGADRSRASRRRPAMGVALLAALFAVAAHVGGGHAAAGDRLVVAAIASQWAHFSATGVWFGGLAALLLGIRGAPAASKAEAARRFSRVATIALIVVMATGAIRAVGELSAWRDLISSQYGRLVLAKIALSLGIVAFAAFNHWRSLVQASTNLRPLRLAGAGELALAMCALTAAAFLGAMPPPAAEGRVPVGFIVSGADFGTTIRVRLTTPSEHPGPNRFIARIVDYDSGKPVSAQRVSLRFTPIDDPGFASTSLDLAPGPDDSFIGSGANIAFGGRWRITALIERGRDSIEAPMEVETK